MSEYKGIKGFQVQTRTEDPSPTEAQVGDFYYNSTTGQFKNVGSGVGTGSWASGENLNTQRGQGGGTGASLTASILAGGKGPPGGPSVVVEQYNGSSWTEITEINTTRSGTPGGAGPYTAALIFGGEGASSEITNNEYYNGSSWTELNDLNQSRSYLGSSGSVTQQL